jgi:hypothetical protein
LRRDVDIRAAGPYCENRVFTVIYHRPVSHGFVVR